MNKRSTGIVVALAVVVVLSLGLAGGALAMSSQPVFSSVSPATASNGPGTSFVLTIHGSNFSAISSVDAVRLQMAGPPFDTIYATNEQLNIFPGGGTITCSVNTAYEVAGTYDVEIDWWNDLIGQLYPDTGYISNAFTVTSVAPSGPHITSVSPTKAAAGGPAFTLTVNGSDFATGSMPAVVKWNGTALALTSGPIINPTAVLYATVPAALIATPGTALITVTNPNLGGGLISNPINFAVTNAAPVLTGLAPATTWAKLITPPTVVLTGSGFVTGATAVVNGVSRAATLQSASQLSVQLTAADIATAGSFTIAARNPEPGGGTSSTMPFTVVADSTGPVTTISGADAAWHNTPVNLTLAATDSQSGVQMTQWGIGAVPPWTTLVGTTITVPAPADHSGDGVKTVSAFSTDNCNNAGATVTATVNIDTQGPTTAAMCKGSVKRGNNFQLGYRADDALSPTCAIVLKIKKSSGSVQKTFNLGQEASNVRGNEQFKCNFAKGTYKYYVYATDLAGNVQTSVGSKSFKVK